MGLGRPLGDHTGFFSWPAYSSVVKSSLRPHKRRGHQCGPPRPRRRGSGSPRPRPGSLRVVLRQATPSMPTVETIPLEVRERQVIAQSHIVLTTDGQSYEVTMAQQFEVDE